MTDSTTPTECCVPCAHVGAKRAGGSMQPICKLRAGSKFADGCVFSPNADAERKANVDLMPRWARIRIGCRG